MEGLKMERVGKGFKGDVVLKMERELNRGFRENEGLKGKKVKS